MSGGDIIGYLNADDEYEKNLFGNGRVFQRTPRV